MQVNAAMLRAQALMNAHEEAQDVAQLRLALPAGPELVQDEDQRAIARCVGGGRVCSSTRFAQSCILSGQAVRSMQAYCCGSAAPKGGCGCGG